MNNKEFVEIIMGVVRKSAIEDTMEEVTNPSGRNPSKDLVQLSEQFNELSDGDKDNLLEIVKMGVDGSLFGILAVLDGVRAIENDNKGELRLTYHNRGK